MDALPTRYAYRRPLGKGGAGEVVAVFDRVREEEVALKLARAAEGEELDRLRFRFRQEFWTLASLRHPHLVGVHDYGELPDGRPYFTMELVDGEPIGAAGLRGWLPELAAALGHLHRHGWVHGDLKLEHVGRTRSGELKLLDLGLLRRAGEIAEAIGGSPPYMAPEVIRREAVDARADLYALGVLLFRVLTERLPFVAERPIDVLRAHLYATVPSARALNRAIAPAIDAAVTKLLAKDPAARFPSAAALRLALGWGGEEDAGEMPLASPMIGREAAREAIAAFLAAPGTLWLTGPAGMGKSRLLGETAARAQLEGTITLAVGGLGKDAPPYMALSGLLRAWLAADASLAERLGPALEPLAPRPGKAAAEGAPAVGALHAAVLELASAHAPGGLWLVDDADRLDDASLALLRYLERQGGARGWRWIFAAGEAPAGAAVHGLAPLDEGQIGALTRALLGEPALAPALAAAAAREAEGLPGRLERWLVEARRSGELRRGPAGWELKPARRAGRRTLPRGLSPAAVELARLAALLGERGDLRCLGQLFGGPEPCLFEAVRELVAAGVLACRETRYAFASHGLAERLAADWTPAEARPFHTRAADWLSRSQAAEPSLDALLAFTRHALAGEAPERAVGAAILAARRLIELYAVSQAEPLLEAWLALPAVGAAERRALWSCLSAVHYVRGRWDEALAIHERELLAGLDAVPPDVRANRLRAYANLLERTNRYAEALDASVAALAAAEASADPEEWTLALMGSGRLASVLGDVPVALERLERAVAKARAAGWPGALPGALSDYGVVLAKAGPERQAEAVASLREAVRLSRERNCLSELMQALNGLGAALLSAGRHGEARDVLEEFLAVSERLEYAIAVVFARLNLSRAYKELGDLDSARHQVTLALAASRAQGDQLPLGFAVAFGELIDVLAGEGPGGLEGIRATIELARGLGTRDLELHAVAMLAEALVALDRRAEASVAVAEARAIAEATGNAELDAKLERLGKAVAVTGDRTLPVSLVAIAAAPDGAAALAEAVAALVGTSGLERGFALIFEGARITRRVCVGMPEAETFSSSLAHRVLWSGEPLAIEDLRAEPSLADQASIQALALRSVLGVPLDDGQTVHGVLMADSRGLGAVLDAEVVASAVAVGRAAALAWRQHGERAELARRAQEAERLSGLAVAAAGDPRAALGAIARAAIGLVGARRALVLAAPSLAPVATFDAEGAPLPAVAPFDASLAGWVAAQAEALQVFESAPGDDPDESALRAVLAVPIRRHDAVRGVLYMDGANEGVSATTIAHLEALAALIDVCLAQLPAARGGRHG